MASLIITFKIKATNTPITTPGKEKEKLLKVIIVTRYGFLNPKARNMPYSYVLPSTSPSMSENTSMDARMAKKMMTVKNVAFKKSCTLVVIPNCVAKGSLIVWLVYRVSA